MKIQDQSPPIPRPRIKTFTCWREALHRPANNKDVRVFKLDENPGVFYQV